MMDWFHQLPVVWMGVIVFAGIAVVTALMKLLNQSGTVVLSHEDTIMMRLRKP